MTSQRRYRRCAILFFASTLLPASVVSIQTSHPYPASQPIDRCRQAHVDRRHFIHSGGKVAANAAAVAGAGVLLPQHPAYASDAMRDPLDILLRSELNSKTMGWNLVPNTDGATTSPLHPSFASIRYSSSSLASSKSRFPCALKPPTTLPNWMAGTWIVKYKFQSAAFPQSRRILTLRVPGAGIGTNLSLPNVGFTPAPFTVRFGVTSDQNPSAYEDLAYTVPRRFEAFWPDAKVISVRTGDAYKSCKAESDDVLSPVCSVTGEGCTEKKNPYLHAPANRIAFDFDGPTRSGTRRSQTIDCTAVDGVAVASVDGTEVVSSRQYVQYNVQQDLELYYKEVCNLRRVTPRKSSANIETGEEPNVVEGRVRVGAFLPYTSSDTNASTPKYDEGQAVATYDYKVTLKKLTNEEALLGY